MAIKLEDKTNVLAPNTDFPYGNIKDDTGIGDGTPIDVQVYADIHQFFARMLALSGIVANSLPDNATNGFQYFEAFSKFANVGPWIDAGSINATPNVGTIAITTNYHRYKLIGKTLYYQINGIFQVTSGTPDTLTLIPPVTGFVNLLNEFIGSIGLELGRCQIYANQFLVNKIDGSVFLGGGNPNNLIFNVVAEIS